MEELNQAMMETEIKKETKDAIIEMWRKTGYEAQGQQIENAGLNKALLS